MTAIFLKLLNMSITAGWIVLAVILLRLLLKKMPKQLTCMLWALVGIRLVFPFSIDSIYSLIPSAETIPEVIVHGTLPEINSGISTLDRVVNSAAKASFTYLSTGICAADPRISSGAEALELILHGAALLWFTGMCLMLCYMLLSYLRLSKKLRTAVRLAPDALKIADMPERARCPRLEDNILQSEFVDSPFILGLIKPRIYIPFHLDEDALPHVLAHEYAHLARKDHLVKAFAFCLLCVYWFHPLLWAAYILLCRDIELACDEKVLQNYSETAKKGYLLSLIGYDKKENAGKIPASACPLAFGEVDVKERIVRAKTWKKPAPLLVLSALLLCAAAAFCLLTNPREEALSADTLSTDTLYSWRTKYIGDNSAVGNIIYNLTFPEDMTYKQFALQTDDSEPYAVTITFALSGENKEAYYLDATTRREEIALLQRNACMMFSLIENAEIVNFKLVDESDEDKRPLTLVYSRQWAEFETACDLWKESETKEQFEVLLTKLEEKFSHTYP